ncbi:MAG TPA: TfoX/Sxy family protein [Bacteroidales bacterium]|nr:TfoX/Sxy family protein [Bacteroidales bacterium]
MATDLTYHVNIGKDTEAKLVSVGIDSMKKLVALGSEKAFLKIQTVDPGACLSLLYGLEGAILGVKYNEIPAERKQELKQFYSLARKNGNC